MFFRFTVVVLALLALALAGVAVEKRKLELQREISLQEYRRQQLLEQRSRLRIEIERLSAPQRFSAQK
jgi:cell division protein FtsL